MTSQLLINEPPLQVLPTLATFVGLNEAIVLQQIHYWLNPQVNKNYFEGRYWVYNTYGQWQKQFPFFSERTLRRTINNLEILNILVSCKGGNFDQTKFYTIGYEVLEGICLNSQMGQEAQTEDTGPELQKSLHPRKNTIHSAWSNLPDHLDNMATPPGQSGQTIRSNWPPPLAILTTPPGQIGHLSYTENTTEITSENTLPPLLSPLLPRDSFLEQQQEEEEEEINFETSDQASKAKKEEEHMEDKNTAENQFFCEMIAIWNQTVQKSLNARQDVCLTGKRKAIFKQFLQEAFLDTTSSEKLEAWQDYCTLIAKSAYLRGQNSSGFKVSLEWSLVPDNAFKVLEGAIYDKPELADKPIINQSWEVFAEELTKSLPSSPNLLSWLKISINIAKMIGQAKYKSWFPKVSLKELTEARAVFAVEGQFSKDYITQHFSSEIKCAVQTLYPQVEHIDFQVSSPAGGLA
jgi:hypothetical protein